MAIGELEFLRARELRHHKSRNVGKIRAVRLHRIGVENWAKVTDREIEDLVNQVSMHYEITKCDFPMGQGIAGPTDGSMVDTW